MNPSTRPGDHYRRVGGALYGRLVLLLNDEATARRAADELFVRFMARKLPGARPAKTAPHVTPTQRGLANPIGRDQARSDHAGDGESHGDTDREIQDEWRWIYRVATNDGLQRLPDRAIPAGPGESAGASWRIAPPMRRALPPMSELRRLDELHANARVLVDLDGLSDDELARVLGPIPARLHKVLRGVVSRPSEHPSRLQLEAETGAASVAEHVASCGDCATALAQSKRRRAEFAQQIGPAEVEQMAATIRAARAGRSSRRRRRRIWQATIVTASLLAVCVLALLVARPRTLPRAEIPYAGAKGASLTRASGLQITLRRDDVTRALDPETTVRAGDQLLFRVRTERPRFLELRAKQGAADERRVFPAPDDSQPTSSAAQAVLVSPGQLLERGLPVIAASGNLWITARFADHAFAVDRVPGPDVEVVPVRIPVVSTSTSTSASPGAALP